MSRLFDGSDDQMVYNVPGEGLTLNGAYSLLVVVRIMAVSDFSWQSFIETETSGAAAAASLGRRDQNPNGPIYTTNGSVLSSATNISDGDSWMVVAATKAAGGSAAVNTHKCLIDSTVTSASGSSTLDNGPSVANGVIRLGGNDDFANMRLAAAAIWDGTVITGANVQTIANTKTTQQIADLSPTWLVDDSDAFVSDLIGSIDRSSVVGTADDADDPSGWVYGLGGGGGTTVSNVGGIARPTMQVVCREPIWLP